MLDVEIMPIQDSLVLRARGSELLIMSHHVVELKTKTQPKEFARYFLEESLVNRPARKLFLAWLRKDGGLWRRIFDTVKDMELGKGGEEKTDIIAGKSKIKESSQTLLESKKTAPTRADAAPKKSASETDKKTVAKVELAPTKKVESKANKKGDKPATLKGKAEVSKPEKPKVQAKAPEKSKPVAKAKEKVADKAKAKKTAGKKK